MWTNNTSTNNDWYKTINLNMRYSSLDTTGLTQNNIKIDYIEKSIENVLDLYDIEDIENYVRKKKLQKIKNK